MQTETTTTETPETIDDLGPAMAVLVPRIPVVDEQEVRRLAKLLEGNALAEVPQPVAPPPELPEPPEPRTWASGFVGGTELLRIGDGRQMAYVVPVGPVGSTRDVTAFGKALEAESERGRRLVAERVRAAVDAVPSDALTRMRDAVKKLEADAAAAVEQRKRASKAALDTLKRGDDPTGHEEAADAARLVAKNAARRAAALKPELEKAEAALKAARDAARKEAARVAHIEATADYRNLAAQVASLVAAHLPALAALQGALKYTEANR